MSEIIHTTGITGFIGRNLLPLLLKKYRKVINHNRKSKKTRYTLYTSDGIEEINFCDSSPILLHLATNYNPNPKSIEEEKEIREANYFFPKNIAANFSKVISICSYQQLLGEKYQNLYSETKTEFNEWCQSKVDQFIKIYLFDSFGYGDTRNKVVDVFIKNSIKSKDLFIPETNVEINLTEVSEITNGIMKSIDLPSGSYSLKSENNIALVDLARKLIEFTNSNSKIIEKGKIINLISKINNEPENIYESINNLSFDDQLRNRIDEIKKTEGL